MLAFDTEYGTFQISDGRLEFVVKDPAQKLPPRAYQDITRLAALVATAILPKSGDDLKESQLTHLAQIALSRAAMVTMRWPQGCLTVYPSESPGDLQLRYQKVQREYLHSAVATADKPTRETSPEQRPSTVYPPAGVNEFVDTTEKFIRQFRVMSRDGTGACRRSLDVEAIWDGDSWAVKFEKADRSEKIGGRLLDLAAAALEVVKSWGPPTPSRTEFPA